MLARLALYLLCALLATELEYASALDNGRAITPPMGYFVCNWFHLLLGVRKVHEVTMK